MSIPVEWDGGSPRDPMAECTSDDPTNHQGDTCPIHEAEDDDPPEVYQEDFATEAEAKGFAYGLTWGDEPQWIVHCIEPVREPSGPYFVRFYFADDES